MKFAVLLFLFFIMSLSAGLNEAAAVDFRLRGIWIMGFGYGQNGSFQGSYKGHSCTGWDCWQDSLTAEQKIKLWLDAVVSDDLSGCAGFKIGTSQWGKAANGAALGADQANIKVSVAYIDWILPLSPIKTRMGLHYIITPAFASGNSILNGRMAGITTSANLSDYFSLTVSWGRPYNDNYPGYDGQKQAAYLDNLDIGAIFLPLRFSWLHFTPWLLYAAAGPNVFRGDVSENGYAFGNASNMGYSSWCMSGLFPAGGARHGNFESASKSSSLSTYGNGWWFGISGEATVADSVRASFDLEYGIMSWPDAERLSRRGWFASLKLEKDQEWGETAIYAWYGSGDDANPANGSERMPAVDPDNTSNYSRFAFDGALYLERNALIANNLAGTWGIGASVSGRFLWDECSHILRINLIGGTNSPQMAKKMSLSGLWANSFVMDSDSLGEGGSLGMPGLYMTTGDFAMEFGSSSFLQINEQFGISLEAAYIALWLDTSRNAWGARHARGESIPETKDAWNISASFVYSY